MIRIHLGQQNIKYFGLKLAFHQVFSAQFKYQILSPVLLWDHAAKNLYQHVLWEIILHNSNAHLECERMIGTHIYQKKIGTPGKQIW